jgi:hypothetical protein
MSVELSLFQRLAKDIGVVQDNQETLFAISMTLCHLLCVVFGRHNKYGKV